MARRPAGARTSLLSALTATLLFLPLALTSQQQEQQHHRKSPHENGPLAESFQDLDPSRGPGSERRLETTRYKYFKDTASDSNTASAIATLAPAGHSHAVRAPPAQGSGKSAGLSTQLHARSLQDWEVEDIILLATVDGSIYARDRKTGAPRWALGVDKPMVETIYHRENKSSIKDPRPEDDFLWIVEPSRDGDIYIYNQGINGGLQRLRLTVKKLVEELSPYAGEDPAVVYTAEKTTTLYTVNAVSGQITKIFSSRGSSMSENEKCRRVSGLEGLDDEECKSSGSLVLGRTEYTVGIQNRETAEPICTLMYSEWGPNNRDSDLQSQYTTTMDQRYVYSRHDGNIYGFDHIRADDRHKPAYTQKFPSPVVRVFDVARPMDVQETDTDVQLVVLPQPHQPIEDDDAYNTLVDRNRIFVNHTKSGGWYAMSEATYPLVTGGAQTAQVYRKDWLELGHPMHALSPSERRDALVGVHSLSDFETKDRSFLTIAAPEADVANDSPVSLGPIRSDSMALPVLANSYIIGSAASNAPDILVVLVLLVLGAFLVINRRPIGKILRNSLEIRQVMPPIDRIASVPSSPTSVLPPHVEQSEKSMLQKVEDSLDESDGEATPKTSRSSTLLEPPILEKEHLDSLSEDRGRKSEGPKVRIVEPSPSPAPADESSLASPEPEKKKARRGCRGGSKHKKKKGGNQMQSSVEEIMQIPKAPVAPEPDVVKTLEPDVIKVNGSGSDPADISSPTIQIGHLKVYTDTVLGFGSHGTVVYKGTFGGRDVAVKRMLQEFYDIASHEVSLLQESDDHPNVIRYYDKESTGEFLYIALELCPASLQDVIEKPMSFPVLLGTTGLDLPDVLKQITAGVRYLHSLKIVHRDLKPQNILVAAPKKLPGSTAISSTQSARLLISDFGLCKKLEGDQSSFRATTAHAAGTSGWRAPELLVDEDASPNNSQLSNDSTRSDMTLTAGQSGSEPLVLLDPQTNRRATRAIDIFSLGCVFYYVLTRGNHPFDRDGKYMREANIVKGNHTLDDLASLGDYQWEARDLIASMLSHNPAYRPSAAQVLHHPFFWDASERLEFLCHASDQFEFEPRDPPSAALAYLEEVGRDIISSSPFLPPSASSSTSSHHHAPDFLRVLPKEFKDTLGKQRKYQGDRMLDLLRALRNKKNHYEDMPEGVKEKVGGLPGGYLGFWTRRFPGLLMGVHGVVRGVGWEGKGRFRRFYGVA